MQLLKNFLWYLAGARQLFSKRFLSGCAVLSLILWLEKASFSWGLSYLGGPLSIEFPMCELPSGTYEGKLTAMMFFKVPKLPAGLLSPLQGLQSPLVFALYLMPRLVT